MIRISNRSIKFGLFLILLIFMPMHTLIFSRIFASVKILSIWRDIIILILVSDMAKMKIKYSFMDLALLLSIIIIMFFSIFTGNASVLNTTRLYVMPILVLW